MNTNLIENVDYTFIYPEESQTFVDIRLLSGKFSGIIYRYGKVGVEEDGDNAYLKFEYDIISSENPEKDTQTEEFKNHIGDILVNIIGEKNEVGSDTTEEFDL